MLKKYATSEEVWKKAISEQAVKVDYSEQTIVTSQAEGVSQSLCGDILLQKALALGMTPVQAFLFPCSNNLTVERKRRVKEKSPCEKTGAERTKKMRLEWKKKGFKQLSLTVPDTQTIRVSFYAIQDRLKEGANWEEAVYADKVVAPLIEKHANLIQEIEILKSKLKQVKANRILKSALLAEKVAETGIDKQGREILIKKWFLSAARGILFSRNV